MYHNINPSFIFKLTCIICVAGINVNDRQSKIRNNGGYFYMAKNIKLCSYSDYRCKIKTIIILIMT